VRDDGEDLHTLHAVGPKIQKSECSSDELAICVVEKIFCSSKLQTHTSHTICKECYISNQHKQAFRPITAKANTGMGVVRTTHSNPTR
jgi:hypothetical protein